MENIDLMAGDFGLKNHIVICNWTDKANTIVQQLHDVSVHDKCPIIIVTNKPERVPKTTDVAYRGLLIISGDPADKEILERADIRRAKTVVILVDDEDRENADSKSILTALAVDAINPNVHLIVELVKSSSELYFKYTHVNEIICLEQLSEKLLAQSSLTPGLSQVYMDLLTQSAETNEIYQELIPKKFVGKTYREVEKEVIKIDDKDIILIGFTTIVKKSVDGHEITNGHGNKINEKKIVINPKSSTSDNFSKSYKFQPEDTLFLISYEKPHLELHFQK